MTNKPINQSHQQRRRHFIDTKLQGRLLVALVLLEVIMLGLATLYLYLRFSAIIDANLFVIHRPAQTELLPEFLAQMGWVVLVMSLVNTLALLAAHALWSGYIKRVVQAFRLRLAQIARLDLRPCQQADTIHHSVIERIESWRVQEQHRLGNIHRLITQLDFPSTYTATDRARISERLASLRQLLKPAPAGANAQADRFDPSAR